MNLKHTKKSVLNSDVNKHESFSEWPSEIKNQKQLNKAVVCFLSDNEKWLYKYSSKVNPNNSTIEQLATLIVGLLTNKKLLDGKNSLQTIIEAAYSIAKKPVLKEKLVKKPVSKGAVVKKSASKVTEAHKTTLSKEKVAKKPVLKETGVKKSVTKGALVKKAIAKKPINQ